MTDDVEARRQRSKSLMHPSDWTRRMKREAQAGQPWLRTFDAHMMDDTQGKVPEVGL